MKKMKRLLKEMAKDAKKKCRHEWVVDKQGKYCPKCGWREYK